MNREGNILADRSTTASAEQNLGLDDPTSQDGYYYRVDSAISLRRLSGKSSFSAKHWDSSERPWPHASLIAARKTLPSGYGIYRLSFWQRREAAARDLGTRGFSVPHLMTRVKRAVVQQVLQGWAFEEDDYLPGDADLLWSVRRETGGELPLFSTTGIPLREFEVWNAHNSSWEPWFEAAPLLPDTTRLAAAGWFPFTLRTRQGGSVLAYWKILPRLSEAIGPAHWLLLTLDESAAGTLGSENAAIAAAVSQMFGGLLHGLRLKEFAVLTIHPTRDRVWMEQLASDWAVRPDEGRLAGKLRRLLGIQSRVLHAQFQGVACSQMLFDLVRRSGLPAIKREFPAAIWRDESEQ